MKQKILSLFLLTAILSIAMISAANDFTVSTNSLTLTKSINEVSFTVDNDNVDSGNKVIVPAFANIVDEDGHTIIITTSHPEVSSDSEQTITVKWTTLDPAGTELKDLALGTFGPVEITLTDTNESNNETITLNFISGFCDIGDFGDLEIIEIKDKKLDNEDEWDWSPLEDVQFSIEVYNNFDEKKRIKIEYEIYNTNGNRVDFDDEDDNEKSISINDGNDEKVTFDLRVPADIEDGDYELYIKAYIKGREDDTEEGGCIDNADTDYLSEEYYQKITIDRDEDNAVILDIDKIIAPEETLCDEFISVSVKAWNIGNQDEEKVLVNLYNTKLGIDLKEVIKNLDEGESKTVTFDFKIPENVDEKSYEFDFITYYEYDEDEEEDPYDEFSYLSNSKDDLEENFDFSMKIICGGVPTATVQITAELDPETPEAIAGEQVIIKTTIKNTGDEETTYDISISGESTWSSLSDIDPETITLEEGESKDISIILDLDSDAEGDYEFIIKASVDSQSVKERPVLLTIESSTGMGAGITGAAISDHIKSNGFIYAIVIINLILIIAIISVVRRMTNSQIPAM